MDENKETIFQSGVGPVVTVAERSRLKFIFYSIVWTAFGATLIIGGIYMLAFEIPRIWQPEIEPEWFIVGIGAACIFLGYFFISILVRRIRAACDSRLFFRAGPGGISVCYPSSISFSSLMLSYNNKQHDIPWSDVKTWYPFVRYHGFFPVESQIIFEGGAGWTFGVDTLFFTGSRGLISQNIAQAAKRTDLVADKGASQ